MVIVDVAAQRALDPADEETSFSSAATFAIPMLAFTLSACGSNGMPGPKPVTIGGSGSATTTSSRVSLSSAMSYLSSLSLPSATSFAFPGLALACSACGSSGMPGSETVTVGGAGTTVGQPSSQAPVTPVQASRFLAQATMGATAADIADVQSRGYEQWIANQFAMTREISHWDWLISQGYQNDFNNSYGTVGFDDTMWRQLITEPGQLRQRVGMALLEILVVGIDGTEIHWRQFAMAGYVDILLDNAFGNYRDILGKITTNVTMASFLTYLGNQKANPATGALPDENFARELMQLFTIGLHRLNPDGSKQLNAGLPVETYTQADVSGLARIFTGLNQDSTDGTTPDRHRRPLVMTANQHETGASTFLGTTVAAGTDGMTAINTALDAIFAHSNVAPFVSKQLIMRLVTSNPSPAYVGRVSAAFNDNGSGVRGDMKAVIRAILLDIEARADPSGTTAGKLREPVMRFTGWARAFKVTSASGRWKIGSTSDSTHWLAQTMGRSPSVFNFFRPGYTPPNTAISAAGLVAPEFQIANEVSVIGYVNALERTLIEANDDINSTYDELTGLADSQALVDAINLVLASGQISSTTRAIIRSAVDAAQPDHKIRTAVLLVMASPEFIAFK